MNARTHGVFDFTMTRDRSHLQIVSHDEMFVAEFLAQQLGDDVVVERCRLEQAAGYFLSDVDVWKAAVAHHHAAHAIVRALKEFDVRREILCNQIVVRKLHDRHLFV